MKNYKDLMVYQLSYETALMIHKTTKNLPREIYYDLTDQIRRASKSIPINIAEGYGKKDFPKDFRRHLIMAVGSKDEVKVLLDFLKDLEYISMKDYQILYQKYDEIGKMLYGFIKKLTVNSGQ